MGAGEIERAVGGLDALTRRLRRECPWDREQDERSIVPHTVEEAYELVEYGQLDLAELREFTFSNAVQLYTKMNPAFFAGTAIESAVNEELA